MARLVDCCPSSDDDLPDVSSLAKRRAGDKTKNQRLAPATALKSPEKTLVPKSPTKSVRKIRRLDAGDATLGNPLFQRWNSDADDGFQGSPSKRSPRKNRLASSTLLGEASIFDDDAELGSPSKRSPRKNRLASSTLLGEASIFDDDAGSPSKRSPRKMRLASREQSTLLSETSTFDIDAAPRVSKFVPQLLRKSQVELPELDGESVDGSMDSVTALTFTIPSQHTLQPSASVTEVEDAPTIVEADQTATIVEADGLFVDDKSTSIGDDRSTFIIDDKSMLVGADDNASSFWADDQPTFVYDVSDDKDETSTTDSDEADPTRQLELEASIYAERMTAVPTRRESSSRISISSGSSRSVFDFDSSFGGVRRKLPVRILSDQSGYSERLRRPPPNPGGSALQPKHANKINCMPEVHDDEPIKTQLAVPPAPSPSKQRIASQATTADLADSLKALRLHIDNESTNSDKETKSAALCASPSTPTKEQKSKILTSPTKLARIPKTPHRPSVDTFWSQDFVNDWNDEHSPRKLVLPPASKKSPVKASPKKELKKSFEAKKHSLAETFLQELDAKITQGKIAELAEPTGGVKIVWSRTLNTTAGRANWKRETVRTKQADGTVLQVRHKHHASIELAEKVIDDEDRLLNVLAHEFCHLAVFMVDGVTNNPHGREFKAWAGKCCGSFGDRGVEVTTRHSYEIDFKYIWGCAACGADYKRHSRSIDPARHRCGKCKGQLKQTRPVPRLQGKGPSEYQVFVGEQMKVVREENPGSPQKEVMKMVAERWGKRKAAAAVGVAAVPVAVVDDVTAAGDAGEAKVEVLLEQMVDLTLTEDNVV